MEFVEMNTHSISTRKKISPALKGRTLSEETKKKISIAKKLKNQKINLDHFD